MESFQQSPPLLQKGRQFMNGKNLREQFIDQLQLV